MHNVNKRYISIGKLIRILPFQHLCFLFHNFRFELFIKNNIDDLIYCLIWLFLQKRLEKLCYILNKLSFYFHTLDMTLMAAAISWWLVRYSSSSILFSTLDSSNLDWLCLDNFMATGIKTCKIFYPLSIRTTDNNPLSDIHSPHPSFDRLH